MSRPSNPRRLEPVSVWRDQAACRGCDPELWWPPARGREAEGRATCLGGCPVRLECLAYGLGYETHSGGLYGGRTQKDRRRLRASPLTRPTVLAVCEDPTAPGALDQLAAAERRLWPQPESEAS